MSKSEVSLTQYYHKRTKYDPETIASNNQQLNGLNQLEPFKPEKPLQLLKVTILKRRFTRAYNGANLTLDESGTKFYLSTAALHQSGTRWLPDYFDLSLIETFVAISGVNNLEKGCYYLAPSAFELQQIRLKNFCRELHYLCLG